MQAMVGQEALEIDEPEPQSGPSCSSSARVAPADGPLQSERTRGAVRMVSSVSLHWRIGIGPGGMSSSRSLPGRLSKANTAACISRGQTQRT